MALRQVRVGSYPDLQYDDADFDSAIETDHTIRAAQVPVHPHDMVRLSDLPGGSVVAVTSDDPITDHSIVRGDGGDHKVQDSGILISDTDAMTGVDELQLIPKAFSSGIEGTIFYNSTDDHVYVATE